MEKLKEECGVFGIISPETKTVGNITYFGLYALQHRGQESCGIAVSEGGHIRSFKNTGLVSEVFNENILSTLQGKIAIGHVRYSTSGGKMSVENAQPLVMDFRFGNLALAHNGNITNSDKLKKELESQGAIFKSDSDSEVLVHLIARSKKDNFTQALIEGLNRLEGAFSMVIINNGNLYALKDKNSIRPLCIGTLRKKIVFSSESCALDMIGAKLIRELKPGEVIKSDIKGDYESFFYTEETEKNLCSFEYIYFARPDSEIFEKSVHKIRKSFGAKLSERSDVKGDVVIPVPDSGISAALGFSEASKIPYDKGIIRNHYIGRTFIQPAQELRDMKVKMKLNPVPDVVRGKKVIVIDDSIVRGTTSRKIVRLLRNAGAKEIHFKVSSPMILSSCSLGIDTPNDNELIANTMDLERLTKELEADSLQFLTTEDLKECISGKEHCMRCFLKKGEKYAKDL